jgi:hypothetical protein
MTAAELRNPVTMERFTVQPSGPDVLRLEVAAPPGMIRPPRHVHCRRG